MKNITPTTNRTFLNYRTVEAEARAVVLAGMGYSMKLIEHETGMTAGQIRLRMQKCGVKLTDWRNGENIMAQSVIQAVHIDSAGIAKKITALLHANTLRQEEIRINGQYSTKQIEGELKRRQITKH